MAKSPPPPPPCILTLDSLSKDIICKKQWDHGCTLSGLEKEHCDKDSLDHTTSFPPFLAEFLVFYIERTKWPFKGQAFEYSLNPQRVGCLWWLDGFVPIYFWQIQRRLHAGCFSFLICASSLPFLAFIEMHLYIKVYFNYNSSKLWVHTWFTSMFLACTVTILNVNLYVYW